MTAAIDAIYRDELLRKLSARNARLRELLVLLAQDLERIACDEAYAKHVEPLRERARRIREHLHFD